MAKHLLFVLFLVPVSLYSQSGGQIHGQVTTISGDPVQSAAIQIKGTSTGTVTDSEGWYTLESIPAGQHALLVSFIGFERIEKSFTLKEGGVITLNMAIKPSTETLNEVTISGDAHRYIVPELSRSMRIQTPLIEVPQNIQVITSEVLKDQQIFDMLEGVTRNVSGAHRLEHWDNYARINMRGSQLTAFRNGMNMQLSPWSPLTEDMSMVEKIEFVKGPAGFMLAAGEPGGFYNVVTKKPDGIEQGAISFSLGSFDTYRLTTDLEGKLDENGRLLYRLNLMGQLRGSHRDFEYNNRYTIAPVLKYLIDEHSSVTLEYNEQFSQMSVVGSNYAFSTKDYAELPRNFTTAEPNLDPTDMRDRTVMAILEHSFNPDWQLTAQVSYLHFKQIGQSLWPTGVDQENDSLIQRGISIWDALGFNTNAQIFVNGQFSMGSLQHKLLGGLDMSQRDYYADWNQGADLGGPFNIYAPEYGTVSPGEIPVWDRTLDIRERGVHYNNSYTAFYLQDQLDFFKDRLRLTLAGRYTTNRHVNPYGGSKEDQKFTPRLGISWSATPNTAVYMVFDQTFLPNLGANWQGNSFDPVTGENIELGVKREWMDGRWNSSISAYRIRKNNVLTTDFEHPDLVTGQYIYSRQTGEQEVQGLELDIRGELLRNLQLVVNYAYTDARITEDTDPEVVGNRVAGATEHIQNTWLTYRLEKGQLGGLNFSMGYQYQAGRSSWYIFDNSDNALPDYFRLDGGIGYEKDRMRFDLIVNNVLDRYLYSGAPSGDLIYWQTEPGRNFRLTVGYKF